MKENKTLAIVILCGVIFLSIYYSVFYLETTANVFAKQVVSVDNSCLVQANSKAIVLKKHLLVDTLAQNNVINVKRFGATGDGITNDTRAIQNAIDAAKEGETVFFPCANYLIDSVVLKSGITYDFDNSDLVCVSDTPFTAKGKIKAVTAIGKYKALSKTITLDSIEDVETGDLLHVIAFEDFFNTFRKYYYKGGTASVLSKEREELKVFISDPFLFDMKREGTEVRIVKPWKGKICNIRSVSFKQTSSLKYFIQIEYGYNVEIKNVNCTMDDGHNIIVFNYCSSCTLDRCNLIKTKVHNVGYSYNVLFCACTNCSLKNCVMKTMWHCYTNGGGAGCTVGTVIDNCAMMTNGRVPACAEHGNGINTSIYNSTLEGIVLSCGALVKNCVLIEPRNFPAKGSTCFQLGGQHQDWDFNNYIFEDCTIYRTRKSGSCSFSVKNEDLTRSKTNNNNVFINTIQMNDCSVVDQGECRLLVPKWSNITIKHIQINNCKNIIADFPDSKNGFNLVNTIDSVVLKGNSYKEKIALFRSGYIKNILIENCTVNGVEKKSTVLDIYGGNNVILRSIKGIGLPVYITINIGEQNYVVNNLYIDNLDTEFDYNLPTLQIVVSPAAIIENAYINNCTLDNFFGIKNAMHISGSDCTYHNQMFSL